MNKEDNNNLIEDIILRQKDFDLLPRDEDGYCVYDGDLIVVENQLTMLPDGLVVIGNLNCSYNQLTTIPDGLKVSGSLFCYGNKIVEEIKASIGGDIKMDDEQQRIYDRIIKLNRLKAKIDE